jgi:hypothetical protein
MGTSCGRQGRIWGCSAREENQALQSYARDEARSTSCFEHGERKLLLIALTARN